jgi:hypothetical protein
MSIIQRLKKLADALSGSQYNELLKGLLDEMSKDGSSEDPEKARLELVEYANKFDQYLGKVIKNYKSDNPSNAYKDIILKSSLVLQAYSDCVFNKNRTASLHRMSTKNSTKLKNKMEMLLEKFADPDASERQQNIVKSAIELHDHLNRVLIKHFSDRSIHNFKIGYEGSVEYIAPIAIFLQCIANYQAVHVSGSDFKQNIAEDLLKTIDQLNSKTGLLFVKLGSLFTKLKKKINETQFWDLIKQLRKEGKIFYNKDATKITTEISITNYAKRIYYRNIYDLIKQTGVASLARVKENEPPRNRPGDIEEIELDILKEIVQEAKQGLQIKDLTVFYNEEDLVFQLPNTNQSQIDKVKNTEKIEDEIALVKIKQKEWNQRRLQETRVRNNIDKFVENDPKVQQKRLEMKQISEFERSKHYRHLENEGPTPDIHEYSSQSVETYEDQKARYERYRQEDRQRRYMDMRRSPTDLYKEFGEVR